MAGWPSSRMSTTVIHRLMVTMTTHCCNNLLTSKSLDLILPDISGFISLVAYAVFSIINT